MQVLIEVGTHFGLPIGAQAPWGDHKSASYQPPELELAQDQPGLDRLAQPYLVGEQVAHAIARNRTLQGTDLVG